MVGNYSEEKMKGHGAASCQLTQLLLHPTPSLEPPEHNFPNATDNAVSNQDTHDPDVGTLHGS